MANQISVRAGFVYCTAMIEFSILVKPDFDKFAVHQSKHLKDDSLSLFSHIKFFKELELLIFNKFKFYLNILLYIICIKGIFLHTVSFTCIVSVGLLNILLGVKYLYLHCVVLLKFGYVCCRAALERKRDTLECATTKDHTGLSWGRNTIKTVHIFQYCILLLFMPIISKECCRHIMETLQHILKYFIACL